MRALCAVALACALALGACGGDSKEQKASNKVCDARDDIGQQVKKLEGLTLSTATTDQISASLKAIGDDLTTIRKAQGNLSDQRRQEVQSANKAFASQVEGIVGELGSSLSLSDAKAQLTSALQQMGQSYRKTFARIDCSS